MSSDQATEIAAYLESLPPAEGGCLLFLLWLNAVATLILWAARLLVALNAVFRVVHAERPISTLIDCVLSPRTAVVVSATAAHQIARQGFVRRLAQRAHVG